MIICKCIFLRMHFVSCIFIIKIVCVMHDYTIDERKLLNKRLLEYVANICGSWFLMKGATPRLECCDGLEL